MKLLVAAVPTRPPAWVEAGWDEYAKRMPSGLTLTMTEVKPEPRTTGKGAEEMMAAESKLLDGLLVCGNWPNGWPTGKPTGAM